MGYAPDENDDTDLGAADPAPTPAAAPAAPTPAPSAPMGPPTQAQASAPMNPMVRDYLTQQQQALGDAQKKAAMNQLISGLGRAGNTLAHSGLGATTQADQSMFDQMDKNANAPITNFAEQQAADPNSQKSLLAKQLIQKIYPGKFTDDQLKNATADDLTALQKPLEQDETIQARLEAARGRMQSQTEATRARLQAHSDASDDRDTTRENSAMGQVGSLLESARGQPAVAQAEKDIYAAAKVKSLANLYGDPNNLNPQMVKMLTSEVAKIASGGQSTEAELNFLTPNTLRGKMASVWQQLQNKPSAANAGEFVKQYQDYANSLTQDAQKVIKDRYGRIINANSDRLGEDNTARLNAAYTNRFDDQAQSGGSPNPTYTPDVVSYAKAHGITPDQAAQIKARREAKP